MPTTLSGTCTVEGEAVEDAEVYVYNHSDDSLEGTTTSAADGTWSLSVPDGNTYTAVSQYDDGTSQYNTKAYPFIQT